jgi:hypothetical protein
MSIGVKRAPWHGGGAAHQGRAGAALVLLWQRFDRRHW